MKQSRKLLSVLLAAVIVLGAVSVAALETYGTNYIVSTENDLKEAIMDINSKESGKYTITLDADIDVGEGLASSPLRLEKNTVTIYGENHTLYFIKNCLHVTNNATLNLGSADYAKTLSIQDKPPQNGNPCEPLIAANNATLNMYEGVTLKGRNGVDTAGGVQLEKATFNMYGGEITDCKTDTAAGGVMVYDNSLFNMSGGTISNCSNSHYGGAVFVRDNSVFNMSGGTLKDCSSSGSDGGVYVYNSSFEMTAGTIKGCSSANYGGGIYSTSAITIKGGTIEGCSNSTYGGGGVCVRTPNNTDITGLSMSCGEIKNCTATSETGYGLGGGVFIINGTAEITGESKIYNNQASKAGDDIFSMGTNAKLKLGEVPEGLILEETNREIDGWYADGVLGGEDTDRWSEDFAQKFTPDPESVIDTQIALKAAHEVKEEPEITLTVPAEGLVYGDDAAITLTLSDGATGTVDFTITGEDNSYVMV